LVGRGAPGGTNALLVVLDSVRAADCSPFDGSRATTPILERLAREATGETRERLAAPGHF